MIELIDGALASDMLVYSERIVGLVFAPLMDPAHEKRVVSATIVALERNDALLAESATAAGMDSIGLVVVDYYRAVYAAEREAMRTVLKTIRSRRLSK